MCRRNRRQLILLYVCRELKTPDHVGPSRLCNLPLSKRKVVRDYLKFSSQFGMIFEDSSNFPKHLATVIVAGKFAHAVLNGFLLTHFVDPVPIQFWPPAKKLAEFVPGFIEKAEGRNRHASTLAVQVVAHQIVVLESRWIW